MKKKENPILKIVLTGPESTGKTTLAEKLAAYYQTACVPEYARQYIAALNRPYDSEDILKIAKGQLDLEDNFFAQANELLICDTGLLVPKIWSEVAYGHCSEWIEYQLMTRHYDLYLLMSPDIDWEEDPQREHPHFRNELFGMYQKVLQKLDTPFIIIEGNYAERFECARQAIDKIRHIMNQC